MTDDKLRAFAAEVTLTPIEVPPVEVSPRFVQILYASGRSALEVRDLPGYPPSLRGDQLRAARIAAGYTIRDTAALFGLSLREWSGLELGRNTLPDKQWRGLLAAYAATAAERGE